MNDPFRDVDSVRAALSATGYIADESVATTIYVAPRALADRFPGSTTILANGETRTVGGVSIQAVAAYNLTLLSVTPAGEPQTSRP